MCATLSLDPRTQCGDYDSVLRARVRMCVCAYMGLCGWGRVRYRVVFACKVVETVLAIPIPIPSLFCVAFACKAVETALAIPIPILSLFCVAFDCKVVEMVLAIPNPIPSLLCFFS